LRQGFTVSQVVHDYGDVCQSITELAVETDAPISSGDFRVLNGCLDNAIAGAVTEFGRERRSSPPHGDEWAAAEAPGFVAHELRNLLNTALIAFEVVKTGNVGVSGSTGEVLHRSLLSACELVGRSLAGLRLSQGVQNPERLLVSQFIEQLSEGATLAAHAQRVTLKVLPIEDGIGVEADRQVLAAVVMNLLQNAFKFTRAHTTVTLRVGASTDRVLFEIQDECGGLPGGDVDDLFRPFEQRGANRTGLGLGLAFSRLATEVNHGRLYAVNLPDVGCVFTIDLPRCAVPTPLIA
jgi:signal transduction histidine kinase